MIIIVEYFYYDEVNVEQQKWNNRTTFVENVKSNSENCTIIFVQKNWILCLKIVFR